MTECKHQFWKDRNPAGCMNCGKTEEELQKEVLKGERLRIIAELKAEIKQQFKKDFYKEVDKRIAETPEEEIGYKDGLLDAQAIITLL